MLAHFAGGSILTGSSGIVFNRCHPIGRAMTLTDILPSAAVPSAYPSCDPHTVLNPTTTIHTHLTTRSTFTSTKELALGKKKRMREKKGKKEESRVWVMLLRSLTVQEEKLSEWGILMGTRLKIKWVRDTKGNY